MCHLLKLHQLPWLNTDPEKILLSIRHKHTANFLRTKVEKVPILKSDFCFLERFLYQINNCRRVWVEIPLICCIYLYIYEWKLIILYRFCIWKYQSHKNEFCSSDFFCLPSLLLIWIAYQYAVVPSPILNCVSILTPFIIIKSKMESKVLICRQHAVNCFKPLCANLTGHCYLVEEPMLRHTICILMTLSCKMPQLLSELTSSVKPEALQASDSQGAIFCFP